MNITKYLNYIYNNFNLISFKNMALNHENLKKGKVSIVDEVQCGVECIKLMDISLWRHSYDNRHFVHIAESLYGRYKQRYFLKYMQLL